MKQKLLFTPLLLLFTYVSYGQKYTISGFVEDAQSGERLIGATVYETTSSKYGTFTNEYGYFSLSMPQDTVHLKVSYIGYRSIDTTINLEKDLKVTFRLKTSNVLKEVVVTGYRNEVKSSQTGRIDIPVKTIENLPVIFGEADLLKALQLMPGVSNGTDGSSGIYVRGGSPDQNLILLDGVPLYNAMHLAGFFSVFTPEAIKDVSLYKSGFPARFGGRLSSVIDVRMKDGNMNKYTGSLSVGLISSKFTLEGPTVKNKGSFIIAARRTYIDILSKPFLAMWGTQEEKTPQYYSKIKYNPGYYFYDIYAKLNHKFGTKDRVYISIYMGQDKAYVKGKSYYEYNEYPTDIYVTSTNGDLSWGNYIIATRWNHAFNKKLFSNLSLTYSKFFFDNTIEYNESDKATFTTYTREYKDEFGLGYNLGINDLATNMDFIYSPNTKHNIRFGGQGIYHNFNPGNINIHMYSFWKDSIDTYESKFDTLYSNSIVEAPEFALYIEDDFNIGERLKVNAGLRLSSFNVRGKNFTNLEKRISGRFLINDNLSLKGSYAQMNQYLHLVTNNTVGLPLDLWLPATDKLLPENSWQGSGGISWLAPHNLNITLEGYYKKMNNVVEIKEGESVFSLSTNKQKTWEDKLKQGIGWSYGAELFIRKDYGRFTGWAGYTLAWTWRKFDNINNGKPFPYKYDRRHDLNIAINYKISNAITAGAVFVYSTGTPITLAKLQYPNFQTVRGGLSYRTVCNENGQCVDKDVTYTSAINYYGGRNSFRLPAYQRLDLSVNWEKTKQHGTRIWNFGIYNTLNHINPFYTEINSYLDYEGNSETVLSIYSIFPIMPFFSYKFVWN